MFGVHKLPKYIWRYKLTKLRVSSILIQKPVHVSQSTLCKLKLSCIYFPQLLVNASPKQGYKYSTGERDKPFNGEEPEDVPLSS